MNRSGCGIRPKIRPVGSQTPATARDEPLGFAGYASVGWPSGSGVLEDDLSGTIERVEVGRLGRDESALAMCHGQLDRRRGAGA